MSGFRQASRVATLASSLILATAACGGSPSASSTASGTLPSGGQTTSAPASALGGQDLAEVPLPADDAVLGTLLGVPDRPLDPDMAALRDEVLRQVGDAPFGPVTLPEIKLASWRSGPADAAAVPAAVRNDDVLVGFLLVDMAIMGRILPSKQAADGLAGMIREVAGGPSLDGPDQVPETPVRPESIAFDATSPAGSHASGTMETHLSVKAEHSLVSVDLDRQLVFHFTAGSGSTAESGTTTITIHNTASVDFCPDVGGVVPLKLATTFTLAMPSSTVTAAIDGNLLALVDDNANHVFTNGDVHVTRLTASGDASDDADLQMIDLSLDSSGTFIGGRLEQGGATDQAAVSAAGAALADLKSSITIILDRAEQAWQKSSCVAVQLPDNGVHAGGMSDGSGQKDVDPGSKTEFTAQVHHRFEHREVNLPIKVTLQAEKTVDPPRLATTPSTVTYEAPDEANAHNDVTLEVVSKRGKSRLVMRFDTVDKPLLLSLTSKNVAPFGPLTLTYRGTLTDLRLTREAGAYRGRGDIEVSFDLKLEATGASCSGHETRMYEIGVEGAPIPDVPDELDVTFEYPMGVLDTITITCNGESHPAPWTGLIVLLPLSGQPTRLTLGETTHLTLRQATTPTSIDLTLKRPE